MLCASSPSRPAAARPDHGVHTHGLGFRMGSRTGAYARSRHSVLGAQVSHAGDGRGREAVAVIRRPPGFDVCGSGEAGRGWGGGVAMRYGDQCPEAVEGGDS
jgi:hypothetical protein